MLRSNTWPAHLFKIPNKRLPNFIRPGQPFGRKRQKMALVVSSNLRPNASSNLHRPKSKVVERFQIYRNLKQKRKQVNLPQS